VRILTVDGGRTTGWADYDTETRAVAFGEWEFEEGLEAIYDWGWRTFDGGQAALVVPEQFVITGGTARKGRTKVNWTIETNGVCRLAARRFGHELDDAQTAQQAKHFGTDRLLQLLGWWTAGSDHARDAARHLALVLSRRYPATLDVLLQEVGR